MEHFSVVQSVIRAGLSGDKDSFRKQVERLHARLKKAGAQKEAATVERLLSSALEVRDLEPSRVEVSRSLVRGERLSTEVHPPIDRETGARLCSIEFPASNMVESPIFGQGVDDTISGLLREWAGAAQLRKLGVEPTHSLLLFGPPGSGKTMTAHHIAHELKLPLVIAKIDGLISSFLGTTARNIGNLFDFVNRYQCLLLLDEFDAIAKLRDDPHEVGEIKRVVNTLLQNLDIRRDFGITIAITNHDRLLDPAVWRRFETQVHLPEPEGPARAKMIHRFLKPIKVNQSALQLISYCLEDRTGADIERICNAMKRDIALAGVETTKSTLFLTLAALLARSPSEGNGTSELLSQNVEVFISYAASDENLNLTQAELAEVTGKTQPAISRLKKMVSEKEVRRA